MVLSRKQFALLLEGLCYSAFLVAPLGMLALGITGHKSIKTLEKRAPHPLPKVHSLHRLPEAMPELSAWFEDILPWRQSLTAQLNYALYRVGESGRPKVLVGDEDWMFFSGPDYSPQRPRFAAEELEAGAQALLARQQWLQQHGTQYLLFVAPNKGTIYPEYLPFWRRPAEFGRMDQILDALPNQFGIACLDPRPQLFSLKEKGLVYLKHDVHWNTRTARMATRLCWQRIHRDFFPVPGLEELERSLDWEMRWVSEQQGLAEMLGIDRLVQQLAPLPKGTPEDFDSPKIRFSAEYQILDAPHYTDKMPDRLHPRVFHGNPDGPVVFLFTDSFGNWMGPWLQPHCSTLLMARRLTELSQEQKADIVRSLVEQVQPEIMLEVVGEMNIHDIFPSTFDVTPR